MGPTHVPIFLLVFFPVSSESSEAKNHTATLQRRRRPRCRAAVPPSYRAAVAAAVPLPSPCRLRAAPAPSSGVPPVLLPRRAAFAPLGEPPLAHSPAHRLHAPSSAPRAPLAGAPSPEQCSPRSARLRAPSRMLSVVVPFNRLPSLCRGEGNLEEAPIFFYDSAY
jgi:hypothetical protein